MSSTTRIPTNVSVREKVHVTRVDGNIIWASMNRFYWSSPHRPECTDRLDTDCFFGK